MFLPIFATKVMMTSKYELRKLFLFFCLWNSICKTDFISKCLEEFIIKTTRLGKFFSENFSSRFNFFTTY